MAIATRPCAMVPFALGPLVAPPREGRSWSDALREAGGRAVTPARVSLATRALLAPTR